jgi:DNA-binding beta-propeller fold protein YncE
MSSVMDIGTDRIHDRPQRRRNGAGLSKGHDSRVLAGQDGPLQCFRRNPLSALALGAFLIVCAATAFAGRRVEQGSVEPVRTSDSYGVVVERIIDEQSLSKKRNKIVKWVTGRVESTVLLRPYGVAWHGDALVVTDPGSQRILRVDRRNRMARSPAGEFLSPIGVAVCGGRIVVADSEAGRVVALDDDLRTTDVIALDLERPTGIACTESRIFIVETGRHRVVALDLHSKPGSGPQETEGQLLAWGGRGNGPGEFNFPTAIGLGGQSIWVGDTLNFRIQRIDATTGAFRFAFGELGDAPGEMPRIKGLAHDRSGRLWIADAHLDSVSIHDSDGTFLMHIGGTGSMPGMFSFPTGIAAHADGRVAVVDSLNRRIQILRLVTSEPAGTG